MRCDSDPEGKSCDFRGISASSTGTESQRRETEVWTAVGPALVCRAEVRQAQAESEAVLLG